MTREQLLRNLAPPEGKVDVILDTDAYNEIDDQFAISYLLRSPEKARILGFTAAPFFNSRSSSPADGMEKSHQEILKLLQLAGEEGYADKVYRGSAGYLPDEETFVESEAARFIVQTAGAYTPDHPLYVLAIGAITNVASALLMEPGIAERIVVVWLGGHAFHWPDNREFNLRQDVAAARVVCNCGCPLVLLPCMGVVSALTTTGPELDYWLLDKNPLSDYLARNTRQEAESYALGKPWSRVIWDISTVAWLHSGDNPSLMRMRLEPAPIPEYDHRYAFDPTRPPVCYVYSVNRDAIFEDLFARITQ